MWICTCVHYNCIKSAFQLSTHRSVNRNLMAMAEALFGTETSGDTQGAIATAIQSYAASLAIVAVSTLLGLWISPQGSVAPVAMIYLIAVIVAAALWGIGRGLLAGIASALAYDFFFTEPVHTFQMDRMTDVVTVVVLLLAALATSQLAGKIGDQARVSASDAARNATIAGFAGRLLSCSSDQDIAWATCAELHRLFHCNVILVTGFPEPQIIAAIPKGILLTPSDIAAAALTMKSGEAAGRGTGRLQPAEWSFHPVGSAGAVCAAVGLARDDGKLPVEEAQLAFLSSLLEKVALALVSNRHRHDRAWPGAAASLMFS